jgi:hypothetical protein
MKSNFLNSLLFAALVPALFAAPFAVNAAAIALTVAGIGAVLLTDYGRTIEPVRARAEVVGFAERCSELAEAA